MTTEQVEALKSHGFENDTFDDWVKLIHLYDNVFIRLDVFPVHQELIASKAILIDDIDCEEIYLTGYTIENSGSRDDIESILSGLRNKINFVLTEIISKFSEGFKLN